MAAAGCVTTIKRIVVSIRKDTVLLQQLEKEIYPVLLYSMSVDGIDVLEEALDIILNLIYNSKKT